MRKRPFDTHNLWGLLIMVKQIARDTRRSMDASIAQLPHGLGFVLDVPDGCSFPSGESPDGTRTTAHFIMTQKIASVCYHEFYD